MSIVKMKKLRLISSKSQKSELMEKLMLLGCVELDSQDFMLYDSVLSEIVEREYSDWSSFRVQRQIYDSALKVLDKYAPVKTPFLTGKPEISQTKITDGGLEDRCKNAAKELSLLDEKLRNLKSDEVKQMLLIESLRPWKSCAIPLDHPGTRYSKVIFGTLPAECDLDRLHTALDEKTEEYSIFTVSEDADCRYLYVICHRAAEENVMNVLRERGFALPAFGHATGKASELIVESMNYLDYIEGDRVRSQKRILELAAFRDDIKLCSDHYGSLIDRCEAEGLLMSTQESVILQGWVTEPETEELEKLLDEYDCAYELSDPVEEEYPNVPVKLKNGPLTNGLNMVTDMYSLPQYGTVDANPLMAPFFILFYGIMMADMGYGLLMLAIGPLVTLKLRPDEGFMKYFGLLMIEGGIATFAMGAVTGGFFGDALTHGAMLLFGKEYALPKLFDPLNDTILVLIGALILGFIHLNAGMAVSFYTKIRDRKVMDALWYEGAMWLVFIGAALAFLKIGTVSGWPIPLVVALLLFFYGSTRGKKGVAKLTAIFSTVYNELTGWFGDLLSYSRLMALMLAGSVIAQVFNTLGAMPGNFIVFLIIAIIGNALNFGLNLIGCYVHDLRLQCLEFFNKFYTNGGRPFKPLKVKSKFYKVTK